MFFFHASAIGVSGQITRPVLQPVPSVASALPPGGGYTFARQDPDQLLGVYSHGGATTETTGNDAPNGDHQTTAAATVQNLNIGNILLLDSCTSYLSSVYPADGLTLPRFNLQGSIFNNLRIAGRQITLTSQVALLSKLDTFDKFQQAYRDDADFRKLFLDQKFMGKEAALHPKQRKYFPWCPGTYTDWAEKNPDKFPLSRGMGVTTFPLFLVENQSEPGFQVSGNVITVDNFGTIVLGEVIISPYEQRLTMVHVELGSASAGKMSACIGDGNAGDTTPP